MIDLEITAEHIAKGKPKDPSFCPIALAIRERFGDENFVCVTDSYVEFSLNGKEQRFHDAQMSALCSGPLYDFINSFDEGEPVDPLTLKIYGKGETP